MQSQASMLTQYGNGTNGPIGPVTLRIYWPGAIGPLLAPSPDILIFNVEQGQTNTVE